MTISILLAAILLTISGIAAATFAIDVGRNPARWLVAGLLVGPIALLVLLVLPSVSVEQTVESPRPGPEDSDVPESTRSRVSNWLIGVVAVVVIALVAGLSIVEMRAQLYEQSQSFYLDGWEKYGEGLLQAASGTEGAIDTFVVIVARDQIRIYQDSLQHELRHVEEKLVLAVKGFARAAGPMAVWSNLGRVFSFRQPVPTPIRALSAREQSRLLDRLAARRARYQEYLDRIHRATVSWR